MFFTGDTSTRKRVDLGGRSSKERDRQKLLEQTRLERNKRLWFRQQNSAAVKIQKCFRGRKAAELERSKAREKFFYAYGKVDRNCFHPSSEYLRLLFFFFNPKNPNDFSALVETCRAFMHCVKDSGNVMSVFVSKECVHDSSPVDHRVKRLAYNCVRSLHENRHSLKNQLLLTSEHASLPAIVLLDTVAILIDPEQPGTCKVAGYLLRRNVFTLFREILLAAKENAKTFVSVGSISSLEHAIALLMSHVGQRRCTCAVSDLQWSFSSQILTVPFLWQFFPHLKEVFTSQELSKYYIHQVVSSVNHENVLDNDTSSEFPAYACLLGNVLESASIILALPNCTYDLGKEVTIAVTLLLEAFPPTDFSNQRNEEIEEEAKLDDKALPKVLHGDIEKQIYSAMDPRFFIQLMNILFRGSGLDGSPKAALSNEEVAAVGSVCALLHAIFNTLSLERIMTALAYRTELVTVLWNIMKRCHENKKWPCFHQMLRHLHEDAPGWLLPLAVFCPVYKHILMIVDNEEFYEKEKPLSIADVRDLVVILKQALWHLLWMNPVTAPASVHKGQSIESVYHKVSMVVSELLSQLQDWNSRRQFIHPSEFHADSVNENFVSQAAIENTRANDILRQAPFLVPFTSRVRIFTSQLAITRQRNDFHTVFARHRFRIRRDHILEDAYNQLNGLSEEDLRGVIRISFINEFGAEEAGIDGGGIFKDFMENITRAAFDVQYGLFKETGDHMLYPNPGSGMIHDQHLQFFRFLGTVLAKAMFEGILVDIPFATFFLSKLKQKYNYLNDLPSLDPELYRHLLFLKHYEGDLAELELYFVIVNNEYGEQMEEELLPGGKNIRVTNENVITFIHLMANHRLNFQIRQQSSYFLRGFQQLIHRDWIQMFNEHELQLLISGSLDGLDIDDLRSNTNYTGGYHSEHYVIEMFWEVLKSFSFQNQTKFLKFVTGCSRGPLLGFRYLEPLFCIQRAAGTASEDTLNRLPTSATCMNLLKLPPYRSKEQLERKLLYAISADAGFDLS